MVKRLRKTSIKDIAIEAGVAISTVSFVINNKDVVSPETKQKVQKAIEKLGYRTNRIARSLRTRTSKAIGVVLPDISIPFMGQVVKSMEEISRQRGYSIILGCSYYNVDEERKHVELFTDQLIDGIIFFNGYDNFGLVSDISKTDIPIVALDREFKDNIFPSVTVDNVDGIKKAVDYLCKKGHRHIGFVGMADKDQTLLKSRKAGYIKGLKSNGIRFRKEYILEDDNTRLHEIEYTFKIFRKYLEDNKDITAIVTQSDYHAYGSMKAAKETGLKIPRDLSIVGYDDLIISNFMDPPLTTIRQPIDKMGKMGMSLLLDIIEGKKVKNKRIVLRTELVERDSVRDLNVR